MVPEEASGQTMKIVGAAASGMGAQYVRTFIYVYSVLLYVQSSPYNRPWRPTGGVEVCFYSFFNLGARWGWVFNAKPRPLYHQIGPVPTVQVAGWAPGPVWTGADNLTTSTRFPSQDLPTHRESLFLLRYPGPYFACTVYVCYVYISVNARL